MSCKQYELTMSCRWIFRFWDHVPTFPFLIKTSARQGWKVAPCYFAGLCKRSYLLLRCFLVIVHMPQRYSSCLKLVSSFKNDDREMEGNVKYKEFRKSTNYSICGGRNYVVCWMADISITNNFFFWLKEPQLHPVLKVTPSK